jgi:hypothetical protein
MDHWLTIFVNLQLPDNSYFHQRLSLYKLKIHHAVKAGSHF